MNKKTTKKINKNQFIEGYFDKIRTLCSDIDRKSLANTLALLERKLFSGRTLFVAGNGGSAATGSHMVCDLAKTVLGKTNTNSKKRFRVINLTDNVPWVTALGNDLAYEYIFSEQLRNLGKKGDVLLVITGSGNSKNLIELVKAAKEIGVITIGFLGFDGGKIKDMVDHTVIVPYFEYGPVEDMHMIFDHLITAYFSEIYRKS
jgi:D-sedoheptulose 7-phosphate isomerase